MSATRRTLRGRGRGRARGGVMMRAVGPPGPLVRGPLRVSSSSARAGLVVFSASAWFAAVTALFVDPQAGLITGILAGLAVGAATRS